MRIVMLSWEYPPHVVGGLGNHVAEIVPALADLGVEIHLVTPRWNGGSATEDVRGAQIYRVDPPDVSSVDFYDAAQQTNKVLQEQGLSIVQQLGGVDLIHAHDWLVAFAGIALKHALKTPLLSTIHATELGRNRGVLHNPIQSAISHTEWVLVYESWRVICCSHYMAQEVRQYFGCPADKIDVIPNGIVTSPFDDLEGVDLSKFRARFAAPTEQLVFSVGRLVYEKGIQVLIDAVPLVLAQHPNTKFVIAGTGGMSDALRRQADALGVASRVYFTGFISNEERNRLLKIADCAVFPSLYEPFGIVALEAMSAKTPVVVAETGGLREVVEHGETGITVYQGNPESLAWGILHTLQHPEWAQARVKNAYRRVREEYDWYYIAEQTLPVYEHVIAERALTDW